MRPWNRPAAARIIPHELSLRAPARLLVPLLGDLAPHSARLAPEPLPPGFDNGANKGFDEAVLLPPMRSAVVGLLLLTALVVAVDPAAAQDAAAPHLSPQDKVLYAHHHDSDTTELNGWMNTLAVDPTANDIALGPSGQFVGGVATAAPSRTLTLTLNPALAGTVQLDPSGNIVVNAYIGSGSSNGALRVETAIKYGADTVATGAAQNHVYQASTGQYGKLTWTLAPSITEFAPGKDLVWTITMSGVAQAGFLGVSEERGASNIELPVLSSTVTGSIGGGSLTYHDLNGTEAALSLPATASNASHQYNWSSPGGALALTVADPQHAGGNATIRVLGADNATLADVAFNGTSLEQALDGAAGNWTILVQLQNYTGNLTLTIAPAEDEPGNGGPGTGSGTASATGTSRSGTTSSPGNGTKPAGGKDTPLPALPALLGAVAAAVALARRRR